MDQSRSNTGNGAEQVITKLEALKARPEAKALARDIDQIVQEVRNLGSQTGSQQSR